MTAKSELFVTEDVFATAEEQLPAFKAAMPKSRASLCFDIPVDWLGLWDPCGYPDSGEALVKDGDKTLGKLKWEVEFFIEKTGDFRYINARPINVQWEPLP